MLGVRAYGLGGQDGDKVGACRQNMGEKASITVAAVGQVYKQPIEFVYLGGAISADREFKRRDNPASSEGLGVLPTVHDRHL